MLNEAVLLTTVKNACAVIFANEGAYGSVNKNDNGALSVGKVQWHAGRALSLLKTVTAKAGEARTVLGGAFFDEIQNAASGEWDKRVLTDAEGKAVSKLLSTPEGRAAQDLLAEADIRGYILKGMSQNLTDGGALIYFADFANQYGANSALLKKVTARALTGAGDARAMYDATKELTQDYLPRREKVFKAALALEQKAQAEATADNAAADGIIGDRAYWLSVMLGETVPSGENVKKLLDNIHIKLG